MKLKDSIGEDWFEYLSPFLKSKDFLSIQKQITEELSKPNTKLVPSLDKVFEPFKSCPLKDLKVVLLNDTPAKVLDSNDGLAFSSTKYIMDAPLETIEFFDGIEQDCYDGFNIDKDYDYHRVAKQGVLMLNFSMSLIYKEIGIGKGEWYEQYFLWKPFIEHLLFSLAKDNKGLIFILVGKQTRLFAATLLQSDNYVFPIIHPRDAVHFAQQWDTAGVFSLTNEILTNNNNTVIKW